MLNLQCARQGVTFTACLEYMQWSMGSWFVCLSWWKGRYTHVIWGTSNSHTPNTHSVYSPRVQCYSAHIIDKTITLTAWLCCPESLITWQLPTLYMGLPQALATQIQPPISGTCTTGQWQIGPKPLDPPLHGFSIMFIQPARAVTLWHQSSDSPSHYQQQHILSTL